MIGLGLLLQACPSVDLPCEGVDENRYTVSNPGLIRVYPEQTTFEVGDTIWIESMISSVQTTNAGQEVNIYEELGVGRLQYEGFLFAEFDPLTNNPSNVLAPNVFIIKGFTEVVSNADGSQFHQLEFEFLDTNYLLNIGYVLSEKGSYSLYDPDLDRMRIIAKIGNGCGEKYTIYTSLANPNNGYAYEFEVIE